MKSIAILGSTGSIGRSSLEVIANFPGRFRVAALAVNKNIDTLKEQIEEVQPDSVAVLDERSAFALQERVNGAVRVYAGEEGLLQLVGDEEFDVVISSFVGFSGLKPTIRALERGKTVALANKETLVAAGEIIMRLVEQHHARLIPIDSEHSAILQCLVGEDSKNIARLILTASGGPFLGLEKDAFPNVTVEEALNHPNWRMGNKITIDSATLMNKGLEVIEAHWLFDLPADKIEVVIHPQSIIHSMVEFVDGSVKAQLGMPDMKIPIQYALTYPERAASTFPRINFSDLREMTFLQPDLQKFECLAFAYEALAAGGTAPAVLNAANEVAVQEFLSRNIKFTHIPILIREAMREIRPTTAPEISAIVEADAAARNFIRLRVEQLR